MLVRFRALVVVALYLAILAFFEPDRAVFVTFLALIGSASTLAGRDLARVVSPKVGVIGSLVVWSGVAVLYATGTVRRDPGYSQYLVYLAVLFIGYVTPLTVLIEVCRNRKRRAQHLITDARDQGAQKQ